MKNSRILITGINGLLGSHLKEYLDQKGYKILGVSKSSTQSDFNVDLCIKSDTFEILDSFKPEIIINLAAMTDVDECEKNPHEAYLCNCLIPKNLADWVKESGSKAHIIHLSTDQVYGTEVLSSKESNVFISNIYGLSKMAGEHVLNSTPSTIIRTNFLGKSIVNGRESLSDWAIRKTIDEIKINLFQDIFFSPLSINSLLKYIEMVMNKPITGTFNLGSQDILSKADLIILILKGMGLSTKNTSLINSSEIDFPAKRPLNMGMDSSLFEKRYNVKLPTIEVEVKKILEEYKNG